MAKRKGDDIVGNAIALVGLAVTFFVLAAVFLAPFALLAWWLYAEWAYAKFRTAPALMQTGGTEEEKGQLKEWREVTQLAAARVDELNRHGDALGLSRRVDGAFDNRSRDGKGLNDEINKLHAAYGHYSAALNDLEDTIHHREKRYLNAYAGKKAGRSGFFSWSIVFVAAALIDWSWDPQLAAFFKVDEKWHFSVGAALLASGVSLVVVLVFWFSARANAPRQRSPWAESGNTSRIRKEPQL